MDGYKLPDLLILNKLVQSSHGWVSTIRVIFTVNGFKII